MRAERLFSHLQVPLFQTSNSMVDHCTNQCSIRLVPCNEAVVDWGWIVPVNNYIPNTRKSRNLLRSNRSYSRLVFFFVVVVEEVAAC